MSTPLSSGKDVITRCHGDRPLVEMERETSNALCYGVFVIILSEGSGRMTDGARRDLERKGLAVGRMIWRTKEETHRRRLHVPISWLFNIMVILEPNVCIESQCMSEKGICLIRIDDSSLACGNKKSVLGLWVAIQG